MRAALPPRLHNSISYAGAALALLGWSPWKTSGAWLPIACFCAHFVRRTLESLFVHRYSGRPVPPADYLVEYAYYWGFAYWIARDLSATDWSLPGQALIGAALVVFGTGELGNAWSHQRLRALRSRSGESSRAVPEGGLFNHIACPHYLFEITSWVGFALLVRSPGAVSFAAVGAVILASYARSRHRAYRETFDGMNGRELYPRERRALIPFVW